MLPVSLDCSCLTVPLVFSKASEKQTTLGRRQCFTKEAFEKPKGATKNVQYRDTDNIWHKTMFYNPETEATLDVASVSGL
jgi:hypothetical protein